MLNKERGTWTRFDATHQFHEQIVRVEEDNNGRHKRGCDAKEENVVDKATCSIDIILDFVCSDDRNDNGIDHLSNN